MFNMIVTVISIALVAAIAIATVWYGGSYYTQQKREADAVKLLNGSAHIRAATEMYRNDHAGAAPSNLQADLVPQYLRELPQGGQSGSGTWSASGTYAITTLGPSTGTDTAAIDSAKAACIAVNDKLGLNLGNTVPGCSSAQYTSTQVCCDTAL